MSMARPAKTARSVVLASSAEIADSSGSGRRCYPPRNHRFRRKQAWSLVVGSFIRKLARRPVSPTLIT